MRVLDSGSIEIIETWGSDERIIESARMSTNKGFQGWETDQKLLAFLWNNKHHTPFEMAGATIEVKAPIFVFREWHRHRTQSYNEMSARYIPLPDENYLPTVERCIPPPTQNKQAQGTGAIPTENDVKQWLMNLDDAYDHVQRVYENGLTLGIPKEVARLPIPVARYSKMRASANLRNWLGFLALRNAPNAQWEIREYAITLEGLLSLVFPRTLELFGAEHGR